MPGPAGRSLAGSDFVEIRFGGSGGQGVILMGVILAVAATRDRRFVVQTQSYGPEARGGYSRSDVIIARGPVAYPQLIGIDLLVALSAEASRRYLGELRRSGIFVYDSEKVSEPGQTAAASFGIPFARVALEATGKAQTTNIVTLGAVVGLTEVVSRQALEKSVMGMVPPGTEELNLTAMHAGFEAGAAQVVGS